MKPSRKASKILIINQVALNLGDAAILWGNIEILKRRYGANAEIVVYDLAADAAQKYRPWVNFRHSLFFRPVKGVLGKLLNKLGYGHWVVRLSYFRFLLAIKLIKYGLPLLSRFIVTACEYTDLQHYATADLIVSAGGTYLTENYDLSRRIKEFRFALATGKPLVLFTQTLGPFSQHKNQLAFRKIFSAANVILLRDEMSKNHIVELGVTPKNIHLAADAAFVLADKDRESAEQSVKPVRLAISVRSMEYFDFQEMQSDSIDYYNGIVAAIRTAVEDFGAKVTFLSTCQGIPEYWTNDADTADKIFGMLPKEIQQHVEVDRQFQQPWELIDTYRQYDAVIATRMHAAILSLCAGTPTMGIAYEFKTVELFNNIDMPELTLRVEDFTSNNIQQGVNRLLSRLDFYREKVRHAANKMCTQAWKAEQALPDLD